MNKRIKKKKYKEKINTPTKYLATGGFYTPYACPNCKTHYTYSTAYYNNSCVNCNQKLIWWEVFKNYSPNVRQEEKREYYIVKEKRKIYPFSDSIEIGSFPTLQMAINYAKNKKQKNITIEKWYGNEGDKNGIFIDSYAFKEIMNKTR